MMRSAVAVLLVLCAAPAHAGQGRLAPAGPVPEPALAAQGTSAPVRPRATPDFLFGRPDVSVGVRGGWLFARAHSDWYDFVTGPDQLTLERSDFNAPGVATDVGIAIGPRLDAVVGVEFARRSVGSEYRELVDNNRQPIAQTTDLRQVNVSGSLKVALTGRGRQISSFAWVPTGLVPYAGAGGGMLWYRLRQSGDFVDALDPRRAIFTDVFESRGWTPAAHVFGGVDVRLARRLYATLDVRYLWAGAEMSSQFVSFEPIDLSGLRTTAGINFVF